MLCTMLAMLNLRMRQRNLWKMLSFFVCSFASMTFAWGHDSMPVTINTCGGGCGGGMAHDLEHRLNYMEDLVLSNRKLMEAAIVRMEPTVIRDCSDVYKMGNTTDGVYSIHPANCNRFKVKCVFDSEGQWTVIQSRDDGTTDFQRSWWEYVGGFGNLQHNFWLGLRRIFSITNQRQYRLRVDLEDWEGTMRYAEYKFFLIGAEEHQFPLRYANYTGTAGDAFGTYHYNMKFSTFDQDNDVKADEHCAMVHGGGWWYRECDHANLNGFYNYNPILKGPTDLGIEWDSWKNLYSFKSTRMRIRPAYNDQLI